MKKIIFILCFLAISLLQSCYVHAHIGEGGGHHDDHHEGHHDEGHDHH
jgi:hypothetical protein